MKFFFDLLLDLMNFQFKAGVAKKAAAKPNAFQTAFSAEDESDSASSQVAKGKPIDYLQLKVAMETKAATESQLPSEKVEIEERADAEREAILKRRQEILGGRPESEPKSVSTVDLKQAGLVMVNPPKDASVKSEAKHIQRMVETAQVNEKFKNLLKMKVAERDKDKAEAEFGERPQEFVTAAYRKQKEESLRLERELEASETQKRDMSNLFREMLGSGQYARTKFDTTVEKASTDKPLVVEANVPAERAEPSEALVKKVLEKVVSEDSKEITRAIHEKARLEAFRIVDQIEQLVENDEEGSKEEARISAKERYLQRKRQRLNQEEND